jgi:hypothetical protein
MKSVPAVIGNLFRHRAIAGPKRFGLPRRYHARD